ncbi:MAG: FAD-dependent oxidoreductase [Kiritimatiellaeota bacterium]|nr:FAD-dependent oxidoreductase [Kiritimatiellota bacterium]
MQTISLQTDFCVVGGGLAGMIAAISAARHGAKTVLIQDRPVLGGNASSEVRMHVCGAGSYGANLRETGIIEELMLDNYHYNREPSYSMWDAVLYGKAKTQENLTLILNASVNSLTMEGGARSPNAPSNRIKSVTAWQPTTETWITVEAALFADCSGDGILAPLSGADFRIGREARAEFGESIAPEVADKKTMGMSCLFQAREHTTPQPFTPFPWAYDYSVSAEWRKHRDVNVRGTNFWWMEVGGEADSIHDTEKCRDELLKIAFGVWDYLKNHDAGKERFANFALDWQAFLPGKRESRRYCGDVILNQNDVEAAGKHFDDNVAYGGWSMDDHFPGGFYHLGPGTIFHRAPCPYGIPYRTLYSRNIGNLFCAGRCHSATHSAMSSTRVMGTTSLMGQAVGTAAAIAIRDALTPRGVYEQRIRELQQTLLDDDAYIPWQGRDIATISKNAKLTCSGVAAQRPGEPDVLRNGIDRPVGDTDNSFNAPLGSSIEYDFGAETDVSQVRLVFDSDLNRRDPSRPIGQQQLLNMRYYAGLNDLPFTPPATLVKDFRIETKTASGEWQTATEITGNWQRLVKIPLALRTSAIRLIPLATHGAETARIFAFEVK